ncbi:MAG: hypothetical protein ABSA32_12415 [Candidatus Acidiferrales bacterium]|jgi:hypothetical protein
MNTGRIGIAINLILVALLTGAEANTRVSRSRSLTPQTPAGEALSTQQANVLDEEPLPLDPKERDARLAKNTRYNGGGCDITSVTPDHPCFFEQMWPRGTPLIPLKESTVAVAGEVSRIQPFLSEDRTHIYTEISVRIEEAFKSAPNFESSSGQTIVVDQIGGAVRMPSGQIVQDGTQIDFLGRTRVGGRYVLFASAIHQGKDLTLIRGYELRDGQVFILTDDGGPGSVLLGATIPGGADASTFSQEKAYLQAVRNTAAHPNSPAAIR